MHAVMIKKLGTKNCWNVRTGNMNVVFCIYIVLYVYGKQWRYSGISSNSDVQ